MGDVKIYCSKCGKKLLSYNPPGFIRYKSPVKRCPSCNTRYVDPRCWEIAIQGLPRDTFNVGFWSFVFMEGHCIIWDENLRGA